MKAYSAILAALAVSACATTQTPPAETASAQTDANGNELRCERVSGSRLPGQRVCRTEAEWAAIQTNSRDLLNEIQRQPQDPRQ